MQVQKRDGQLEDLNIDKLHKVVMYACEGIAGVSASEVEINSKIVEYKEGAFAQLTIWDIGGQDRFKILRRNFYEGTYGALVVFDLSRAQTFSEMKQWVSDMNQILERKVPLIILGNKSDLVPKIGESLNQNDPIHFAEKLDSVYLETSAKIGVNVQEAFAQLTKMIVKNSFGE